MQSIHSIGDVPWTNKDIKLSVQEFLELYNNRPIQDNEGGMKSPHMFATWFLLKRLQPSIVIESGIWKGQGTWLIEKTLPNSTIICIDINLNKIVYKSEKAQYLNKDFSKYNWKEIRDKDKTLLFFDDHQNSLSRVKTCYKFGFKHLIFEDNYPAKQGDCYSLKKAFMNSGFNSGEEGIRKKINAFFNLSKKTIPPNSKDAKYLQNILEIYYEFPPIFKKEKTRWNDSWNESDYPTPTPVFNKIPSKEYEIFWDEAIFYTWLCYVKIKSK